MTKWACRAQVKDDFLNLVAAACVLVASKQGERPSQVPTEQQLESVTGLQVPCPALPCPALPCPALPCPALPFVVQADVSPSPIQTKNCHQALLISRVF